MTLLEGEVYCGNCGSKMATHWAECKKCGYPVDEDKQGEWMSEQLKRGGYNGLRSGADSLYHITSLSKEDILCAFNNDKNFEAIKKRVEKMTEGDMRYLASKLADDYCEQLFWSSLKSIFEYRFMKKN